MVFGERRQALGRSARHLLQEAAVRMPGLNSPMVYLGAWRSFFALHAEDAELQGRRQGRRARPAEGSHGEAWVRVCLCWNAEQAI